MKSVILSASIGCGMFLAASAASDYRISGPYVHDNLSIFLIHASTSPEGKQYLTFNNAMQAKKVIVYETSKVNSLAIENVSSEAVFIQGGDIVKGGQQDRVITNDFVLPPKSGRLPISAFCVEQGRWSQRGSESVHSFSASTTMLPSKALKKAAIVEQDQQKVWQQVAEEQTGLASRVDRFDRTDGTHLGGGVAVGPSASRNRAFASPSSLPLTLESRPVRDVTEPYIKTLIAVTDGKRDVVGFAFAVNGELESADVYASSELFSTLWRKLLTSSAVEAARLHKSGQFPAVEAAPVEMLLRGVQGGSPSMIELTNRVKLVRRETSAEIVIESREGDSWIHRSYLKK